MPPMRSTTRRPVDGLRRAQAARTFYFDPTFTLQSNVVDSTGAVLFPAGTRKNPLEVVSLSKHLLFFDARDPGQVARARELIEHYQGKVKPILVGGSYLDLMKRWNKPVFYDQDREPSCASSGSRRSHQSSRRRDNAFASMRCPCDEHRPPTLRGAVPAGCVLAGNRGRHGDLHGQVSQSAHRHLLVVPAAHHHRQRHDRQLRWTGGQRRQPGQSGLQLRRESDDRSVDRVLGAGAPRRSHPQAVLPAVTRRPEPGPRHCRTGSREVHTPGGRR